MKTYKFRLYPSAEQERILNNQLELCRELYNATLEQRLIAYKYGQKINYNFQQNQLPELRNALPEYKGIYSRALQDVVRRVDRAFDNFFRRVKEKKAGKRQKAGFPRFKPKTRYRSMTYSQSGFKVMENGHLKLSKIGELRMFMHRDIHGDIKTLTISRDSTGKWHALFSVAQEESFNVQEKTGKAVGIDMGLLHFATMSDGTVIEPPQFLRKAEKKIRKAQKALSRKKRGSNNWEKAKGKLSKRHQKVKNQREDFEHKLSNQIVKSYDLIVFEDLKVGNMMKNHYLAKSIADASWSTLIRYTSYKAESAGKLVVLVNPKDSSRTCSRCGWVKDSLKLSERIFHCDVCGLSIDRDLNAAINILKWGLMEVGRGTPEFTPAEIGALPARATSVVETGSPHLQMREDATLETI